jgi:hypothetical protein
MKYSKGLKVCGVQNSPNAPEMVSRALKSNAARSSTYLTFANSGGKT